MGINASTNNLIKTNTSFTIAIVVAKYNLKITSELQKKTKEQLIACGIEKKDIYIYEVPGALEIPLICKRLAQSGQFKSIISLGSVIRGDTNHYELVCNTVTQNCMMVSLEYNIPIIFGVLTTDNEAQAWDRLGGKYGHKGIEFAHAAIEMHSLINQLPL